MACGDVTQAFSEGSGRQVHVGSISYPPFANAPRHSAFFPFVSFSKLLTMESQKEETNEFNDITRRGEDHKKADLKNRIFS